MFQYFATHCSLFAILISDNAKTSSKETIEISQSPDVVCYLKNYRISQRFIVEPTPLMGVLGKVDMQHRKMPKEMDRMNYFNI